MKINTMYTITDPENDKKEAIQTIFLFTVFLGIAIALIWAN